MKTQKEPPLFTQWYGVVGTLLERVGRFPKNLRPTLGNRLIDRSLDVLDLVVRLRYSRQRREPFREANLAIEQVRILVRLAFQRRLFSASQYAELAEAIDSCGRMLGGWQRSETARAPKEETIR